MSVQQYDALVRLELLRTGRPVKDRRGTFRNNAYEEVFEDEDEEILAATPMYGTIPKVRNRSDRAAGPDSSLAMA